MRALPAIVFLFLATVCAGAEDASYSRSLTEIGGSLTIGPRSSGDSGIVSNSGYAVGFRTVNYFVPANASGFYYGLFLAAFLHTAGGVSLYDTRLVHLGWRSPMFSGTIGFDVNFAPTLGTRISDDKVLTNWCIGVSPGVGVVFRVSSAMDVKIAYEPVINLFNFGAAGDVRNLSYSDVSLYLVFKRHARTEKLDWDASESRR